MRENAKAIDQDHMKRILEEWEKISSGWEPVPPGTTIKLHPDALSSFPGIIVTADQYRKLCEYSPDTRHT